MCPLRTVRALIEEGKKYRRHGRGRCCVASLPCGVRFISPRLTRTSCLFGSMLSTSRAEQEISPDLLLLFAPLLLPSSSISHSLLSCLAYATRLLDVLHAELPPPCGCLISCYLFCAGETRQLAPGVRAPPRSGPRRERAAAGPSVRDGREGGEREASREVIND